MKGSAQFPTKSYRQQKGRLIRFGTPETQFMNAKQVWGLFTQKSKTDKRYSIEWQKV